MNTIDLRSRLKCTQEEFGDMFNIPLRTVQNWDYRDCMNQYLHRSISLYIDLLVENRELRKLLGIH